MTTPNIRQPIMTFAADTVALNIICEELYGLIDNDERASFLEKNIPNSRQAYKTTPYLRPKRPKNHYPLGPYIPI